MASPASSPAASKTVTVAWISSSTVSGPQPSAPVRSLTRRSASLARAASAGATPEWAIDSSSTVVAASNRPIIRSASPCSGSSAEPVGVLLG